jgi:hypothetical protein
MPELKFDCSPLSNNPATKIVELIPHPVAILGKQGICDFNANSPEITH